MRALLAVVVVVAACGPTVKTARLHDTEPVSPREADARERVSHRRCNPSWGLAMLGLGQICYRKEAEGAVLASLTAVEVTAAVQASRRITVAPGDSKLEHPAVLLPLVALQDLWVYGLADTSIDRSLAAHKLYAPQDSLFELAVAPFNWEVVKRTDVWAGTLGMLALGIGVSVLVDEDLVNNFGDDANLFGESFSPETGYPLAGATFAGLFTHVAIAEETMFRGMLQSNLARRSGETKGWLYGSLIFGGAHAFNALALEGDERRDYLLYGLPFITTVGSFLGLSYRWNDYSLAPPVAIHFWYDFLLSATFFAMDPENSTLAAKVAIPF